ncbi:hypothetical protein [Rickettsia argasii]|uniref:Uncharacterized protein n=1 Tax=Rickettsia argasii T170-B TaxID=1268837 RepID=A0A0F3RCJ0_9RICK|nr:hypothetical protein [Rickettsia argasii]KJW03711.1 hypothetical protein RAT170B_1689 [Rickettsia argasii T170-B]
MQSKSLYNNAILGEQNTDSKIDSNITPNYKKRRDILNKIVTNHIAKQQQKLTQKNKSIAR